MNQQTASNKTALCSFSFNITYPLIPSRARVFLTTSIAPVYVPCEAVWSRTFVRSKG